MTFDIAEGKALMNKTFDESYALIEDISQNHYQWGSKCAPIENSKQKEDFMK